MIKSLLKVDPKKRFCNKHGASDIKNHPFFEGTNWGRLFSFILFMIKVDFNYYFKVLRHRTPPLVPNVSGPCDTSNFIVYDEDQDSIEFQFFSEIKEVCLTLHNNIIEKRVYNYNKIGPKCNCRRIQR